MTSTGDLWVNFMCPYPYPQKSVPVPAGVGSAGVGYPLCWVCGSVAPVAHDGLSRPWKPR